ncbi:peptidase [Pseudoalteromonas ruthenica]|uniref:M23 family metallopeptidase n=1 Tax=Pseudoalteromonas ruthenica TaxID=151081 RepID=UPI0011091A20|nr:M23 family metallopeptidase [Pseudoalteromonas ruthenica]TLX51671.1 peptidase [Pseudoalteromonas ruthenica]
MLKRMAITALLLGASLCAPIKGKAQELPTPLIKGHLTQGGMVIGQLQDAKKVVFAERELKLSKDGYFVFGFGRDAKTDQQLKWQSQDEQWHQLDFSIAEREYQIDKIEGVASKYVAPPEKVLERIRNDAKLVRQARANNSERTAFLEPVYRPAVGRISGVYGSQRYFNGTPKRPHFGLDIANKTGTPIYAPISGEVVMAHPELYYSGGTVILDHGYGITSTYIHMHKVLVDVGDTVKTGDVIGQIGATGRVTGPHLDWRFNWFNERLDPQLLMIDTLASEVNTNEQ